MTTYEADALIAEAARQRAEVEAMSTRLDDDAFAAPPATGGWSVGECLDHLTLINRIYLESIDEAVVRGRAAGRTLAAGRRPKRHGRLGDAFVRAVGPPARFKSKALPRTLPVRRPRGEALHDFLDTQARLIATIESARDLDFSRVRMSSPFFRLLRLSLGQAFGAMLSHNRRHILQAERVASAAAGDSESRS